MPEVLIPNRTDSDAVPTIVNMLKKELGVALTKILLGVDGSTLNKWIQGKEKPLVSQQRLIYSAGYVVDVLRAHLSKRDMKLWLVSDSEYLYGIPALEIKSRPEDVQSAALNRVSRGEYYELLNDRLQSTIDPDSLSRG